MEMLVHICCAPCATYTVQTLKGEGFDLTGYFFNPNIHPFKEYQRRLETLQQYSGSIGLKMLYRDEYMLEDFFRQVLGIENRCRICYSQRLRETARKASELGIPLFTSTLLISPFQKHEMIKEIAADAASEYGVEFYYKDFREGYGETYRLCKEIGLYRQPYCGCIFSEKERYHRKLVDR